MGPTQCTYKDLKLAFESLQAISNAPARRVSIISGTLEVYSIISQTGRGSLIGSVSDWSASGPEFDPHVGPILSWKLGHEKNLPLPLIQEEQLSVTGERMCTQRMCTKYW